MAGLTPTDIDHINAHATGTTLGDLAEARAIGHALGDHTPAVYAPKAALGHSLGGSGAVEAVLTVQALRDGVVPPTLNPKELDPEIALDVVTGRARRADYRYAVSNSFGIGATTSQWCSAPIDARLSPSSRVNCPSSLMPRRKKSAHPVR